MTNKKVITLSTKPLFWPTFWLVFFWPIGLIWLIYRIQYNFRVEKAYFPAAILLIAIGFYIVFAWINHDWTLSPITWLMDDGVMASAPCY